MPLHEDRQAQGLHRILSGLLPIRTRNLTACSGSCIAFAREFPWCLAGSMPAKHLAPLHEDGMNWVSLPAVHMILSGLLPAHTA